MVVDPRASSIVASLIPIFVLFFSQLAFLLTMLEVSLILSKIRGAQHVLSIALPTVNTNQFPYILVHTM